MNNNPHIGKDSAAWYLQVWVSFIVSLSFTLGGLYFAPIDLWIKGYFAMGVLFTVGSAFSLSKTLRDKHESDQIINRIASAKTEKILHEYEYRDNALVNGK